MGFLNFMDKSVKAIDAQVQAGVDATDRAFGSALKAGESALEHHVIAPVGDLVGTMIGDRESASRTAGRLGGELLGVNPNGEGDDA